MGVRISTAVLHRGSRNGSVTPEDVLYEAMKAADLCGDSPSLRKEFFGKLMESLEKCERFNVRWNALRDLRVQRDDGQKAS